MPTYVKKCEDCDEIVEYFSTISERNDLGICNCGGSYTRILTSCGTGNDPSLYPFTKVLGGKKVEITNREQKKRVFRENGLYEMPSNYLRDTADYDY